MFRKRHRGMQRGGGNAEAGEEKDKIITGNSADNLQILKAAREGRTIGGGADSDGDEDSSESDNGSTSSDDDFESLSLSIPAAPSASPPGVPKLSIAKLTITGSEAASSAAGETRTTAALAVRISSKLHVAQLGRSIVAGVSGMASDCRNIVGKSLCSGGAAHEPLCCSL